MNLIHMRKFVIIIRNNDNTVGLICTY